MVRNARIMTGSERVSIAKQQTLYVDVYAFAEIYESLSLSLPLCLGILNFFSSFLVYDDTLRDERRKKINK